MTNLSRLHDSINLISTRNRQKITGIWLAGVSVSTSISCYELVIRKIRKINLENNFSIS